MPGFEVQVKGLAETKAALRTLAGPHATRITNRALKMGAEVFARKIYELTPERLPGVSGTALPVGALKADIAVRSRAKPDGGDSKYFLAGPGSRTAHVMRWLEYGHRQVKGGAFMSWGKRGKGAVVASVRPFPILRPAYESSATAAVAAIEESFAHDLRNVQLSGGE